MTREPQPYLENEDLYECSVCEGSSHSVLYKNGHGICQECVCRMERVDHNLNGTQMTTERIYARKFFAWLHHGKYSVPEERYGIKRKD